MKNISVGELTLYSASFGAKNTHRLLTIKKILIDRFREIFRVFIEKEKLVKVNGAAAGTFNFYKFLRKQLYKYFGIRQLGFFYMFYIFVSQVHLFFLRVFHQPFMQVILITSL